MLLSAKTQCETDIQLKRVVKQVMSHKSVCAEYKTKKSTLNIKKVHVHGRCPKKERTFLIDFLSSIVKQKEVTQFWKGTHYHKRIGIGLSDIKITFFPICTSLTAHFW